jgi:Flp pilus assembly protein TadD
MPLSTVKRESLIPPVYLISIGLLIIAAFVVLMPSQKTFSFSADQSGNLGDIDDLDIAYLKARSAAGDLPASEMRFVIQSMIHGKRWEEARQLMTDRPDIRIPAKDVFLLNLETATAGYFGSDNKARSASYEAKLIGLLTDFLDKDNLHDVTTLTRASEIASQLKQPELNATYALVLASADPDNDVEWLEHCATTLADHQMPGQAANCYRSAITKADDEDKVFELSFKLTRLLIATSDDFAKNVELEKLVALAPQDQESIEELAKFVLANERPDLAYPLYARLSVIDNDRAIFWLEKAATWAEASNKPGIAAEYVMDIGNLADNTYAAAFAERRQKLLLAAGRNEEALLAFRERLAGNLHDTRLLLEGIDLASALGNTAQARAWNEMVLVQQPSDIDALSRQIDYTLATSELSEAVVWARKIIDVDPYNKEYRVKLAQLEEWNGNVKAAMQQRQWLAEHRPSMQNDRELIRLAGLNWDAGVAAEAMRRVANRKPLNSEGIMKLVALYEQDGRPDLAAEALNEMMQSSKRHAMLLRELAALHRRHSDYDNSLKAWEQFAERYGRSGEESINRMELHWRLGESDKALAVADGIEKHFLGGATPRQLNLLSELGWKHRKPELVFAAAPHLERLPMEQSERLNLGNRMIQARLDTGEYKEAVEESEKLWRKTGQQNFLLTAINIALRENIYPHAERYLDANHELLELRELPDYWLTVANYYNRNQDEVAALETYQNTLMMQPDNTDALAGLIWTSLGTNADGDTLAAILDTHEDAATENPDLWAPFALAAMRTDNVENSLRWFSKIMQLDDHDYNILLSFADALEQTGNANHAYKVRAYALNKLRPLVAAQTPIETNDLVRDYIGLLRIYGSASENEAWTQRVMQDVNAGSDQESAWRQEVAASWYLATQRNDYARLIMTRLHEKRLEAPVWQQLALAMNDRDSTSITEILASANELSTADQVMALRQVGRDNEAYQLALETMATSSGKTRRVMQEQVIAMRSTRPGYVSSGVRQKQLGQLDITEADLALRHTMNARDLGFAVDYQRSTLASDELVLSSTHEDDIAVTAHYGNSRRDLQITTGINSNGENELSYASGRFSVRGNNGQRQLSTEVAFNEIPQSSAQLRLAAKRNRAEVTFETNVGKNEFVRVSGNVNEVAARGDESRFSSGAAGSLEVGTRGSFGSNSWSMGLVASGQVNEQQKDLPVEFLQLSQNTGFQTLFADESQELAISASLNRGGIASEYPQAASPRYSLNARVGHAWPNRETALSLSAGAGFRVLGNDELSLQLTHDRNAEVLRDEKSTSSIGIRYINHF